MRKNAISKPTKFGLEYEPQFVGIIPPLGHLTFAVKSANLQNDTYVFDFDVASKLPILVLDSTHFKTSAEVGIDPLGNIEIRTIPGGEDNLNYAVLRLNETLDKVILNLLGILDFQFALVLPGMSLSTTGSRAGYVDTTKHLSISGFTSLNFQEIAQQLINDYPHFYSMTNDTIRIKPERLHIKLPYNFSDYGGLFEGKANLPVVVGAKQGTIFTEPVLLGHSSKTAREGKRHWIHKADLV